MSVAVRVLVVEDSDDDTGLLLEELRQGRLEPQWSRVQTRDQLASALASRQWDVVVSDGSLPGLDIASVLHLLHQGRHPPPLVVVSSALDDAGARRAVQAGAEACIGKDDVGEVVRTLERVVRKREALKPRPRPDGTPPALPPLWTDESELPAEDPAPTPEGDESSREPYVDALTGLPTRALFTDRLRHALAAAERHRSVLAVMFLDLDRFKSVNDGLGHVVGDELLRGVARRLQAALRAGDTVARRGGDEFTLVLPNIGGPEDAARIARKVLEALRPTLRCAGHVVHVTGSLGVSLYPLDGLDPETLIRNADTALYRAKEAGRDDYRLYSPAMHARAFERLVLESSLRGALEREELVLHYQPQVELATGTIKGLEVLVRWQHPDLELLPPSRFLTVAAEMGLMPRLGEWVLRTACRQAREWTDAGWRGRLAVNVALQQLQESDFSMVTARLLRETGFPASRLELEIPETDLVRHEAALAPMLQRLRLMGVGLAVDHFGSGPAALGPLRRLPVRSVKLDGGLQPDAAPDPSAREVVRLLIALAHAVGLRVIAEAVETERQLTLLRGEGCDEIQGFLVGRALPAPEAGTLLQGSGHVALSGAGPGAWLRRAWASVHGVRAGG